MIRTWRIANPPNKKADWDYLLISPINITNIVVPITITSTDNERLIYCTHEQYNDCLHKTTVTEDVATGDFYVSSLFMCYRPWGWDNFSNDIYEFPKLKVHVNKTYGCYVDTKYGRIYVNSLIAKYFKKKGVYESKKYNVIKTQGGEFGCFIPKDGRYN